MGLDWLDDDSMSTEETLKRFAALNPKRTRGPGRTPRATTIVEAWAGMRVVERHGGGVSSPADARPHLEPAKVAALAG